MTVLEAVLEDARTFGFLGPGPVADHVEHARAFGRVLAEEATETVVDLGSGGGVPGLVVAAEDGSRRLRWVLLDANQKRTAFLEEAISRLSLADRVSVVRARAEELGREATQRGMYDAVVARGFGPPAVTAECAAPLLRVGGRLIVAEPPATEGERWNAERLDELGMTIQGIAHRDPTLIVIRQARLCPDRYPRAKVGKRPLF